jgi:D-sedoheptulose 7-phosphate isomerase
MDVVADLRAAGRPALDLTEDAAILTAIANDIGTEAIFARQVIAYGGARDALLAISTSGNSLNVIAALGEARARGLATIAMVGYDGGRVAAEGLADHMVVTRSQHIPRIQEAQASAYHVLRELVELV